MEKLMKEKNDFITNISNRCLKLIASNKINMVDIAYKMGIRTIDLYNILLNNNEDHIQKDIEFHTAIALSSKTVVVPRLIPVINSSIPLFVEMTQNTLHKETIESHREIAEAIAAHDTLRAQDAMYLHLVYNRKTIQQSI